MNAIAMDSSQSLGEAGLRRDPILGDCASRQSNRLVDRLIEIKMILSRRCFLDLIPDSADDLSGARSASPATQSSASLRCDAEAGEAHLAGLG
ncbi:MAG: hypothetical protein WAV18_05705 [Roseiarcus sp.]